VFEHFSPAEAEWALYNWNDLLYPDGVLVLTVPDMQATLNLIESANRENVVGSQQFNFALRHLRGSQRDEFNVHKSWYTPEGLRELMEAHGFETTLIENPHLYPAIAVRGKWSQNPRD